MQTSHEGAGETGTTANSSNSNGCKRFCGRVLKSLSLSHDESGGGWKEFAFSPWCTSPGHQQQSHNCCCCRYGHWFYLLYRWALVAYFHGWLVYGGVNSGGPRFFIYLTEWSYLAWCSYLILSAVSTSLGVVRMHCCKDADDSTTPETSLLINREEPQQQSWGAAETQHDAGSRQQHSTGVIAKVQWFFHKVHWVLFYLGVNNAIFVALLFWIVIYGISHDVTKDQLTADIFQVHGVNAIFGLADIFATGVPVNALHVVFPIGFGTAYAVFSGIFYSAHGTDSAGNRYVYSVLDWSKPGRAFGFVVVSFIVAVILHACVYGLYRLRAWILSRIQRSAVTQANSQENHVT